MKSLISIVIVTWNRCEKLKVTLESTLCNGNRQYIGEYIIVDNCSDDETESIVNDFSKNTSCDVKYIKNNKNVGCPIARNQGLKEVNYKYSYCLDDDGWLTENSLKYHFELMEKNQLVAVSCSKILDPASMESLNREGSAREVAFFSAGASFYRTDAISKCGYFPPYFRQMEESHLALRLIDAGYKIYFCPESIMYHLKSKSIQMHKEEMFLNFNNEMVNYKNLLNPVLSWFLFIVRIKSIYGHYKKNSLSYCFLSDLKNVFTSVISTNREYNVSMLSFYKFIVTERNG